MFGPPGTGKTHLAVALGRKACRRGIPVRFFTAAELVMRLLRANAENRLDKELTQIGKAGLIILDELGYVPIDEEGSRLLFQVVTNAYERQSVIHDRQHRVRRMGQDLRRPQHGTPLVNRPHRPPRQDDQIRGRVLPQDPRPHAITNKHNQTGRDQTLKRQQTSRSPGQLPHDQTARPNLTQHTPRGIKARDGKVCLSPMIDCYDGMVVAHTVGTSPNAGPARHDAGSGPPPRCVPTSVPRSHGDRGCRYRCPGWLDRMSRYDLVRSMGAKGCSPDNAAAEGFFGRMKTRVRASPGIGRSVRARRPAASPASASVGTTIRGSNSRWDGKAR